MKKFNRWLIYTLASVVATMNIVACSNTEKEEKTTNADANASQTSEETPEQKPSDETGEEIIIGFIGPLTGEASVYGESTKKGAELAVKKINEAGGIKGRNIKLIIEDDKHDATESLNGFRRLVDKQNIQYLIGPITSTPAMAVAPEAAKANLIMITPTGTQKEITEQGDSIFRTCFIDEYQGVTAGKFAEGHLKARKAAIITDAANDYSIGVAEAFKREFEARGGEVVAAESYNPGDVDFKAQLTKIMQADPDIIYVPDYYNTVLQIVQQAREVGFDKIMLGPDGWDGVLGALGENKADILENTYFTTHYSEQDDSPVVQDFLKDYRAEYNEDPTAFSALGYDTVYLYAKAIETADSFDKDAVIEALNANTYESVTGSIKFDADRNPIKSVAIVKIEDGKYALETKVTPD